MCEGVIAVRGRLLATDAEEPMLRVSLAIVIAVLGVTGASAACPRGQKALSGACVASCPSGYDDQGANCVFRRGGSTGGGV